MNKNTDRDLKRYVPTREIYDFIKLKSGKEPEKSYSKESLLQLINSFPQDETLFTELNNLIARFRHAGKGSYYWSYPSTSIDFNHKVLDYQIREHSGHDIFQIEKRAELDSEPKLVHATWINEQTLKLDYAYKDKPFEIEVDYEIQEIVPTRRVSAFLRNFDNTMIFEGRGDIRKARKVFENIGSILDSGISQIDITDNELEQIKQCLNAYKKGVKHKKSSSIYDTVDLEASPKVIDLDAESDYITGYGNDEIRRARYEFDYVYTSGLISKVSFYIIVANDRFRHSGIRFMTEIPEEVVDYVLSCIKRVKGI